MKIVISRKLCGPCQNHCKEVIRLMSPKYTAGK